MVISAAFLMFGKRMFSGVVHLILRALLTHCFVTVATFQMATASEVEFYRQCHKFLPIADEFARECEERARPFSRMFYPGGGNRSEAERFSVYFRPLDAPSRFVLGCVLNFKHKINFVGIYYSATPLDMSRFQDYRIIFIDFNDYVGLEIDGKQHTLLAARQFVTEIIPPRVRARPKNCDDAGLETINETAKSASGGYMFRKIDDNKIEYCLGSYCKERLYSTLFGRHQAPIVYSDARHLMVDGNGALMIDSEAFQSVCANQKENSSSEYNIIYEQCPERK